jgi:DNA polymerase-3 subunit gamma/tau
MVRNLRGIAQKEGVNIDDESLHVIASKADGAMRDALTIFDQTVAFCGTDVKYEDVIRNLNVLDYEYSFKLVDAFLGGDYATAFLVLDEILAKGFNALHFVGSLSSHLRNLVVAKTGGLEPLLELPESLKKRYAEQAGRCSHQFLYDALGITTSCESGYKAAVNPRLHIEFALMRLSYLVAKPAAQSAAGNAPSSASLRDPVRANAPEGASPAVVSPSPAPATPTPATPRRRVAKSGSALSMSALLEEKPEEAAPAEAAAQDVALPADETVRLQWKELAKQYENRPRLASMLASGTIDVREENGVKLIDFLVLNDAQKQWVEEKLLRDLESRVRDLLSCPKINILVSVKPMDESAEKVPYMPEEKAKDLMEKNPDVRAFVADLGLDTK